MEKALIPSHNLLDPAKWGWKRNDNGLGVTMATLPEASTWIYNIQKGYSTQFKCVRAVLKCTALCSCQGECQQFVVK